MDTWETLTGKRERAPAEGALDSDIPNQSVEKICRLGDCHLAFVTDKDVAKEHARRRRSDMTEKIDTQTRQDRGASFVMDRGGPVLSGQVAEAHTRVFGQELTGGGRARACGPRAKSKREGIRGMWGNLRFFRW